MYDSNTDDRTFLTDRIAPGVRSASARSRDATGIFSDSIDDTVQLGSQWIPPQRPDHELTPNSLPFYYANQQPASRNTLPVQPQYRDSSSPGPNHGLLPVAQGLPPGLANLGSRPPHDPLQSYYPNSSIGLHTNTNPGATHLNGHPVQPFNDFGVGGMYNVNQVGRGPSGLGQLRGPNAMGPPHLGVVDSHGSNEAQRLGLPVRNVNTGAFPPPQMRGGQMPNPVHMRRLPQGAPHMAPSNQGFTAPETQSAHDLMALLMGKR
jgi:zinc finger CCCH domain-containing protein 13